MARSAERNEGVVRQIGIEWFTPAMLRADRRPVEGLRAYREWKDDGRRAVPPSSVAMPRGEPLIARRAPSPMWMVRAC